MVSRMYLERIFNKIKKKKKGCWIWKARVNALGRPIISTERVIEGKRKVDTFQIHRALYEMQHGELPVRYLDNVCGKLKCVNPQHHRPRTLNVRFWENIKRKGNCWIWKGNQFGGGYGRITVEGVSVLTHRLAWELHNEDKIPKDKMVLHSCNNRLCINPSHLRLGTHQENMHDMLLANRQAKGEDNGNAKLTIEDVRGIKKLLAGGKHTHKQIAEIFKSKRPTITDISQKKTWAWLDEEQKDD